MAEEKRPPGLKPALISSAFRGPFDKLRAGSEGPLFHSDAYIHMMHTFASFSAACESEFTSAIHGTAAIERRQETRKPRDYRGGGSTCGGATFPALL